jgi:lipopolysaccharide transport system permease protein
MRRIVLVTDSRNFLRLTFSKRHAIFELARREFESQHRGTYLGILWAYLMPLTYTLILTVVFTIGLRSNPGGNVPFLAYLIAGMIPWQYVSQNLGALTRSIKTHSFLIKKGDFNLGILPLSKLLSEIVPHLVLVGAAIIICWCHGLPPGVYTLQVFYYLFAASMLLLGLGWLTSATCLFVEDIANVVTIVVQFGFWLTPIFWNLDRMPPQYRIYFKLNPVYYIINGYRNSLIYHIPFWSEPLWGGLFWLNTLAILWLGATVFRRLKPHFGEMV